MLRPPTETGYCCARQANDAWAAAGFVANKANGHLEGLGDSMTACLSEALQMTLLHQPSRGGSLLDVDLPSGTTFSVAPMFQRGRCRISEPIPSVMFTLSARGHTWFSDIHHEEGAAGGFAQLLRVSGWSSCVKLWLFFSRLRPVLRVVEEVKNSTWRYKFQRYASIATHATLQRPGQLVHVPAGISHCVLTIFDRDTGLLPVAAMLGLTFFPPRAPYMQARRSAFNRSVSEGVRKGYPVQASLIPRKVKQRRVLRRKAAARARAGKALKREAHQSVHGEQ